MGIIEGVTLLDFDNEENWTKKQRWTGRSKTRSRGRSSLETRANKTGTAASGTAGWNSGSGAVHGRERRKITLVGTPGDYFGASFGEFVRGRTQRAFCKKKDPEASQKSNCWRRGSVGQRWNLRRLLIFFLFPPIFSQRRGEAQSRAERQIRDELSFQASDKLRRKKAGSESPESLASRIWRALDGVPRSGEWGGGTEKSTHQSSQPVFN